MGLKIINHGFDTHVFPGKLSIRYHFLHDTLIIPAVMSIIADCFDLSVWRTNFGGTLHMHDINLKRVAKPCNLITSKDIGILYILPAWVLLNLAIRSLSAQDRPVRAFYQIGRRLI